MRAEKASESLPLLLLNETQLNEDTIHTFSSGYSAGR